MYPAFLEKCKKTSKNKWSEIRKIYDSCLEIQDKVCMNLNRTQLMAEARLRGR